MRDIDQVIEKLRKRLPSMKVDQLQVKHPGADDDGLWFLELEPGGLEVQIESPNGTCPFLIESDCGRRVNATTVDEAIEAVVSAFNRSV